MRNWFIYLFFLQITLIASVSPNCGVGPLEIPSNRITIRDNEYQGCDEFTGELIIPHGVTKIGVEAFKDCSGFTGLKLPTTLQTIEQSAFNGCSNMGGLLYIPNSVETIGNYAFYLTHFSLIRFVGETVNCETKVFNTGATCEVLEGFSSPSFCGLRIKTKIPNPLSQKCSIGPLTIPDTTEIEENEYHGCFDFTGKLELPNKLTKIGARSFYACHGLTGELVIPDSVTVIGTSAFERCYGFTSLKLSDSLTTINSQAFYLCQNIEGILDIPFNIETIKANAFRSTSLTLMRYYGESINCDSSAFEAGINCEVRQDSSLSSVCGISVTWKVPVALSKKCSTGALTIPDKTEIENYEYHGCDKFTGKLALPNKLTTIGRKGFYGCSGFTGELVIPDSVTSIDISAFERCQGFTSIKLPNSLETINKYAFYHCDNMKGTLNIPKSVKSIGEDAFYGINFDLIRYTGTKIKCGNSVFYSGIKCEAPRAYSSSFLCGLAVTSRIEDEEPKQSLHWYVYVTPAIIGLVVLILIISLTVHYCQNVDCRKSDSTEENSEVLTNYGRQRNPRYEIRTKREVDEIELKTEPKSDPETKPAPQNPNPISVYYQPSPSSSPSSSPSTSPPSSPRSFPSSPNSSDRGYHKPSRLTNDESRKRAKLIEFKSCQDCRDLCFFCRKDAKRNGQYVRLCAYHNEGEVIPKIPTCYFCGKRGSNGVRTCHPCAIKPKNHYTGGASCYKCNEEKDNRR